MTEAEWLRCQHPWPMIDHLAGITSERKRRWFGVACCRRMQHLFGHPAGNEAVFVAEQMAEGVLDQGTIREVFGRVREADYWVRNEALAHRVSAASPFAIQAAEMVISTPAKGPIRVICSCASYARAAVADPACIADDHMLMRLGDHPAFEDEQVALGLLVREVFGNPFCPVVVNPAWRSADAIALAIAAYDRREGTSGHLDGVHLLLLADALEDAGCDNADLLGHLRSPGPHVRGCWALDLILGRS